MDDLKNNLQKISKEDLMEIVENVYFKGDDVVTNYIDRKILKNDIIKLSEKIKKQVNSITASRRFIRYGESFDFDRELSEVINSIEEDLLPAAPEIAIKIIEKFMSADGKILERVDDSAGVVWPELQRLPVLWLQAAAKLPKPKGGWLKKIIKIAADNEYNSKDCFLDNVNILLEEKEIYQLIDYYKNLNFSPEDINDENKKMSYFYRDINLKSLALALKSPELYEEFERRDNKSFNTAQSNAVAKIYLHFNKPEGALKLLNKIQETDKHWLDQTLYLKKKAYELLGDKSNLKEIMRKIFMKNPNYNNYVNYLNFLDDKEKLLFEEIALQKAKEESLFYGVDFLLKLEKIKEAEKLLLEKKDSLSNEHYAALLDLQKQFAQYNSYLPQVLIFRVALLDILDRAYYKAYRYAANYYNQLDDLNEKLNATYPENIKVHADFIKYLQDRHGKKRSFWEKIKLS